MSTWRERTTELNVLYVLAPISLSQLFGADTIFTDKEPRPMMVKQFAWFHTFLSSRTKTHLPNPSTGEFIVIMYQLADEENQKPFLGLMSSSYKMSKHGCKKENVLFIMQLVKKIPKKFNQGNLLCHINYELQRKGRC